jgi:Tol biopolymer transport system component
VRQRFTFDGARFPVWSPDGARLAYTAEARGVIHVRPSNGGSGDEILVKDGQTIADQLSADGRFLTFTLTRDLRGVALPLSGNQQPIPLAQTSGSGTTAGFAQISPNGKWFAYTSSEGGQRNEVYVQSFPPGGGKWQVSRTGASEARWRRDGKELFFLQADGKLVVVPVKAEGTFEAGTPVELFQTRFSNYGLTRNHYDVTSDGQFFVVNATVPGNAPAAMTVALNWAVGLRAK